MKRKTLGTINGVLASVSYGTNPFFTLPLYSNGIGVNSVLFYRYFIALIIYFIWLKFVKKISLKINKKEGILLFLMGILFSLSSLTLFSSFSYLDSGIACTLLFVYPIIVVLLSMLFFKEKISKTTIFAIFLTTIGIILLYGGNQEVKLSTRGLFFVFSSAISYALYIIGVKNIKTIKKMKTDKLTFYVMLFGLFIYIVNLKFCTQLQPLPNLFSVGCILCMAIFPTIISLETISSAIKLIGPTTTSILGALEPLTALVLGVIFFDETITVKILIGIILILFGVISIILRKNFEKKS